jgi:uncharacterized membrane protein HdeD (DUF308 family)
VVWTRGIAGIIVCAVGVLWIAQGSNAVRGMAMSGRRPFVLFGAVAIIVGLALLAWAARVRRRRASA